MEKSPKLFNKKYLLGKRFDDPWGKIDIKDFMSEPLSMGATHFSIEAERDWDGVLEGYTFAFYQEEEETDEEYEERLSLIAKREEEERKRIEEANKKQEKEEYQQYLRLKRKYEK